MKLKPLGETIFVLPDKAVDKTEGGIILTDFSKKRPTSGTIIAIGSKVKDLKVGQRVLYGEFSGAKEIIDEKEIFIMQPSDILATLEENRE